MNSFFKKNLNVLIALKVEEVLNSLVLTDDVIHRIMSTFEEQIEYANSKDEESRKKSNLFWECTFVTGLLNGKGRAVV